MFFTIIAILFPVRGLELLGLFVLTTSVIALSYLFFTGLLQHSSSARPSLSRSRLGALLVGVGLLVFTWNVPMDILGMNFHFTVHMSQHLLLSLVIPPLFLLSFPESWVGWLQRFRSIQQGMGQAIFAFVVSVLFNANIWIWHAPPLHEAMSVSVGLHFLSNLLYLITGLLFWWSLFNPLHKTLPLVGKLLYLFLIDMPMMLLGAGLTFTPPLYVMTMGTPARPMLVSALDQQLGGLLMWIGGALFFIVVASTMLLRWLLQQDRQAEVQAQELSDEELEEMVMDTMLFVGEMAESEA